MNLPDPFSEAPGRTPLHDSDGRPVLVFSAGTDSRTGSSCADDVWHPSGVTTGRAADLALSALAGWQLSTGDRGLAEALTARGAQHLREALVMSHDLATVPTCPKDGSLGIERLTAAGLAAQAAQLAELSVAAYPVGHPDHSHDRASAAAEELLAIGRGEVLGPLLAESCLAASGTEVIGACLVVARPGTPPTGGPWVIDVFRDVASPVRYVGRALLVDVLTSARSNGRQGVSLLVTSENTRAVRLYRSLGFEERLRCWTLAIPQ